jgi:serine/threonine protein kinase/tetratricopeptide (TPR) repeat protein
MPKSEMNISPGTKLGRFEIRSLIGAGGMGEVYLANDTELDRSVAIKILPERLASDKNRLQRFVQEAKAASGLNHPSILTIYEIGTAGDSRFIATEFIDGETLRHRMNRGMKLFDVLEIAGQIASALAAAHAAGIIHRDIKPENIMVRRDGYAKILDFGLAKLTEPKDSSADTEAPTRAMVNTDAGTVMGTANYMSPEQAKGVHIDERTDLWSLGALLYEMTTGHLPFQGETPTETISLILQKEPPPLKRYAHDVPEELDRIVEKALTKDRDERYQTAKDFLIDLRHLKRRLEVDAEIDRTLPPEIRAAAATHSHPGASTVSGSTPTGTVSEVQRASSAEYLVNSIREHRKGAYIVAAAAVVLVAAASLFYFVRSTPAFTEKDTVLLTDFVNTTGEPVFDGTLKQALAVQLGQSPYLNIFPDERVNETLRFMGKQPNERITRDVAKEICQRQGIKAMIVGSIANLGSHYVVTLEAVNANEGDSIAREQIEADSKEQVLTSLGKAATQLREKLGESLASLKKFDAPIEQATTSSLEALKAFSQGNEQRVSGHGHESIPYYKRAVELDPNFALAYARLSVLYNNEFQTEVAKDYATKAYELRDRVSERERYYISEKYYSYVTGEADETINVLKQWAQNYPNDYIPHNNLAVNYFLYGRFEDSLREAREALRLSPNNATVQDNVVGGYIHLARFDEAKDTLEQTLGQNPDRLVYRFDSIYLALLINDKDRLDRDIAWLQSKTDDPAAFDLQAGLSDLNGQFQKSDGFSHRSSELHLREGEKQNAAQNETLNAVNRSVVGQCDQAKAKVATGLSYSRGKIELSNAAVALANCGDSAAAQGIVDELQKRFPKDTGGNSILLPLIHALLDSNRGNTAQSIDDLQPAMPYEFGGIATTWLTYFRGQIYLKGKMGNEAAAEFRKILDHRYADPFSGMFPLAHLGLARASAMSGDTPTARKEYQDFLAAWKDADQDLPVLIEAKKEYESLK